MDKNTAIFYVLCVKILKGMSLSAWTGITKHHKPGGLNKRILFCHNSGCQKSKIKFPADLVSGEEYFCGL